MACRSESGISSPAVPVKEITGLTRFTPAVNSGILSLNQDGGKHVDTPYGYWIPGPSAVGGSPNLPVNTHSLSVPDSNYRA